MLYALVSMYLVFYLTEILNLSDATMWWLTGVFTALRIFDAVNDPFMGYLVDNTNRYGTNPGSPLVHDDGIQPLTLYRSVDGPAI